MPTLTKGKQLSSCESTEVGLRNAMIDTVISSTLKNNLEEKTGCSWLQDVKVLVGSKVIQK